MTRILSVTFLGMLVFSLAMQDAKSQTWTGTTSTDWGTSGNWSTTVPGAGNTALFNSTGNGNVAINLGGLAQPIGSILFDTAGAAAYTFSGNAGDAFIFNAAGAINLTNTVTTAQAFNSQLQLLGAFTATNNSTAALTLNGAVSLASGGTAGLFTVNGSGATTINGVVGLGAISGLTKSGAGQLTLTAANTYGGTTTVSGGTLRLANSLALQGTTLSGPGVIFDSSVGSNVFTFGGLAGSGTLSLLNNAGSPAPIALSVGNNNANTTYSGVLSGAGGSLTKIGTGITTLSNINNSFTGNVFINGGTLTASGNSTGNANSNLGFKSASRTITVNANGTLQFTINNIFGGSNVPVANIPVIVVNGGTLASTRFDIVGDVTLNGGTMVQSASDGGAAGSGASYQGYQLLGTITVTGTTPSTMSTTNGKGNHLVGPNTTFNVANVTGDASDDFIVTTPLLNASGDYQNAVAGLIKNGAGTMALSVGNTNTNAYSGTTQINAGLLRVVPTAIVPTGIVNVADGAAFGVFNASAAAVSIASLNLGVTTGGGLSIGLNGNTSFAPLAVTNAFVTAGTSPINISSTSQLTIGQFPLISYPTSIGGNDYAGLTLGTLPLRVIANLVNNTANSTVDLNVTGTDTIRWQGGVNNVWDINTTANWRTIVGNADTTYLQPAVPGEAVTFNDLAAGNTSVTIATVVSPVSVTVDNTLSVYSFSGAAISGSTVLTKSGPGTLNILNDNTFSGGTTILAGNLTIGNGGALGTLGSGPIANDGVLTINKSSAMTISTAITGTGSLTKTGTGNLTLATFNPYTGGTTVDGGTLTLTAGDNGTGAIRGILTINPAGTVLIGVHDVFGYSNATNTLSVLNINGGTIDKLTGTGINETLTGVIVNMTGGLMAGTGGYYDMFSNGYGDTAINVLASPNTATISARINFRSANTVFTVDSGSSPSGIDLLVSGNLTGINSFGFVKEGLGRMVLTGASSHPGVTTINAGTLQLGDGTTSGTFVNSQIANNASLVLNPGPTALTVPVVISGAGTVTKIGPNVANLSGANNYIGDTAVVAGTLRFNPTATVTMATINVASGARLAVASFDTATNVLSAANLNLAANAGLNFDLLGATTQALLVVTTAVTTTSANAINVSSTVPLTVGQFPLLLYPGSIGGSDFSGFILGTLPIRVLGNLVNNTANSTVDLNVTGTDTIRWTGTVNGVWDINTTQNWRTINTNTDTNYLQPSIPGDIVAFNDLAAGNFTITIPAAVTPANMTVDNSLNNYTFTGAAIGGSFAVVKNGNGTLTFLNNNTFTGGLQVNAGSVVLGNGGTSGDAGPGDIVNNGTVTLNRADDLIIGMLLSGTGSFIKQGSGSVQLTNLNNSFSGDLTVANGTLTAANALNPTASPTSSLGAQLPTRSIFVNAGAILSMPSNNTFLGSGGSAANLPTLVIAGTVTSTRYNALPTLILNGGVLDQSSIDGPLYQGYQFLGDITVGGTAPSTISTGNSKANHLFPGGTTITVADVTGNSNPSLIVSTPLANGSGDYSGAAGFTKAGPGIMLSSAANTYTGLTTVSAGTLVLTGNNTAVTGSISVNSGATLRAANALGGNVTVDGTFDAGNSAIATLTLGNGLAVNAGGRMMFQLAGSAVTGNPSTGDSTLGGLNPTTNNFVNITTGTTTIDPAALISVDATNAVFALNSPYSYRIMAGAGDQQLLLISSLAQFTFTGFNVDPVSASITGDISGNVYLNFTTSAVPEPAWMLLLGLGFIAMRRNNVALAR